MQYKIPVQIENEDPIFMGLSLRQLFIIMVGGGIAYLVFQGLAPNTGGKIAFIPSGIIFAITVAIAIFKSYEMTFIPFVFALIRLNIFPKERGWENGIDSFQPLDIGYLSSIKEKKKENIDMSNKAETLQDLQEKLKKI